MSTILHCKKRISGKVRELSHSKGARPKVGLIPLTNTFFGFELAEDARKKALDALGRLDIELVVSAGKAIKGVEEALTACKECIEADVDLALIFFCSWSNEEIPNTVAMELSNYPIVLWSVPSPAELISPCGLVTAASNFKHLGTKFSYVLGGIEDAKVMSRIYKLSKAAFVAKKLKRARIGVIGYNCPGMIDTTFNEIEMRRLGPEVVHLSLADLIDRSAAVDEKKAVEDAEQLMAKVGKVIEPTKREIVSAAKMYYALRGIAEAYALDAVAVRCWPELREQRKMLPCYGLSRLSDEGIMGVDESDVTGGITQLIAYWLTGIPAFNGDLSAIFPEENAIQLWHCGAASTRLALGWDDIHIRDHAQVGVSVEVEFPLKPGRVTLAKLTRPIAGKYRMLITNGNALEISPRTRGNPAKIRLDVPIEKYVNSMVENGIEHHIIMAYGDVTEELLMLCDMLDIKPVVP
jgi:L-fucose isomerase-like protein